MKSKHSIKDSAQFRAKVTKFVERFLAIEQDRVELCKSLVELVDYDKFALRYINQHCPSLSIQKLKLMERVGRGDFHPALLAPSNPGEAMLALMDYKEQVRGLDEDGMVPVVTLDEKTNEFGAQLIPLRALTTDQVNQVSRVVKGQRVYVSTAEQEAWLVDHRTNLATRPSRKDRPKWVLKDGCAVVTKNTALTAVDLAAALNAVVNSPHEVELATVTSDV